MKIENLELTADNNLLMDAGNLDAQIALDFEQFAIALTAKADNTPQEKYVSLQKIQYAKRVAQLARSAIRNSGEWADMSQSDFDAIPVETRHAFITRAAAAFASKIGPYDPVSVYVEQQSMHPDDWYLWSVAAKHTGNNTWSVWTLNLAHGGLHGGSYNLPDMRSVNRALARKKGVSLAEPESDRKDDDT